MPASATQLECDRRLSEAAEAMDGRRFDAALTSLRAHLVWEKPCPS